MQNNINNNNNNIPDAVVAGDDTIVQGVVNRLKIMNTTNQIIYLLIRSESAFEEYPDQLAAKAQKGSVEGNQSTVYETDLSTEANASDSNNHTSIAPDRDYLDISMHDM
ncbi:hypothetical protein PPL_00755 [Heterostelium album PN500]|uniref:Uncharacterized protein n=1 Tax=Heterostelium pallidum (strain ATCC 26659 / Pp 5 / PN500) TaxID=670386 RepID=D3AXC4_HETP5|nr:hypothetical protein PPL_00755 [Heterostelium album PN500]EFA86193.1 hypothetical protein PPL_00755 [Heterostelium album PN500]|eukprot:XP_020438298.1 hypothetical protein PPL_00755 [Heterostelium album PN500]